MKCYVLICAWKLDKKLALYSKQKPKIHRHATVRWVSPAGEKLGELLWEGLKEEMSLKERRSNGEWSGDEGDDELACDIRWHMRTDDQVHFKVDSKERMMHNRISGCLLLDLSNHHLYKTGASSECTCSL